MRAAVVTALTGPDAIRVQEVADPTATATQVLIDVEYAGVSFPDVLQSRGEYQLRPEPPFVAGWEVSGVVAVDGPGFRAGDRVAAISAGGGLAERVAVDAPMVFPLPESVPFSIGAALPLNFLTAHLALVRRGRLQRGETVLVHGASGGVGTAACAVASALGARVLAVVSTPEKSRIALEAGADEVLPADSFKEHARRLTGGRGVDVVVDPVGGDRFTDSLRSLAAEGRVLVVGFAAGEIPTVRTNRLLLTNTSVVGVATRELWQLLPDYPREQWAELMSLMDAGLLSPRIDTEFSLDDAGAAIRVLDERRAAGKVLVRLR
jgi:NADPH2:quinone reductase